ncbi:MAG: GlxA family transcriptional regulator, partial [Mesorhizobium sp.]
MTIRERHQPTAADPLTFAVLVFPGFPMMAFSSVIEPLRAANVLAKRECYRWIIVGAAKGPVEASNGVVIQPGFFACEAPKVDRIVVCS